jgi:hypothetical protein
LTATLEWNRLGICGNCGQVGAWDFGREYRCQICTSYHVTDLLEAARGVLEEFSEWNLDDTSLRRLQLAAKDVAGPRRRCCPHDGK